MKKLNILHLGIGNVGKKVVEQINTRSQLIESEFLIRLNYCGLFTSKAGYFDEHGFSQEELVNFLKDPKRYLNNNYPTIQQVLGKIPQPFVVIDTTASNDTFPILLTALQKRGYVVLSNKKPLATTWREFKMVHQAGNNRLFYETTVGAALPVISSLKNLSATGDEIIEIKGCLSGTLGFIFSHLENNVPFSNAINQAMRQRLTEPDPRDDLSGIDVARKVLILARIIGRRIELKNIKLTSLYPKSMEKLSLNEFLQRMHHLDNTYKQKIQKASNQNKTLRYVATIQRRVCIVGIEMVDKRSDLGNLNGPDNLILFKTKRYFHHPLVIKGPGAGIDVTAAGVFADLLSIIKIVGGDIYEKA